MKVCMRICGALAVLTLVLFLAGCGGGGDDGGSSTKPATIALTLDWPAITRAVPAGTQSFEIVLKQNGSVIAQRVATRPAGDLSLAVQSKEVFPNVTPGTVQYTIRAFNTVNATGTPLGEAAGTLTAKGGSTAPLVVSAAMGSSIDYLEITSQTGKFEVMKGNIIQLFVTARDAQNRIVPVDSKNFTWSYPDPQQDGRVQVLDYGAFLGQLVGFAVVNVREADSGKMAEATLKISEPIVNNTAVFNVEWPSRSRVVPKVAESIAIEVWDGTTLLGSEVLNRPTGGGTQQKSFYQLPSSVTLTYVATAYPGANKVGVPVGIASSTFTFTQQGTKTFNLTSDLQSTVSTLLLAAATDSAEVLVDGSVNLLLTAYDNIGRVVPLNAGDILWSTSNAAVATVTSGNVRGVSAGTAIITAKDLTSDISATLTVTVKDYFVSVSITPPSPTVKQGETQQFAASVTVTPDVATANRGVSWSVSEGASGGTITQAGLYTAPSPVTLTTAHVVATSQADPTRKATATVTLRAATAPAARFTVTPDTGDTDTVFAFDASSSSDAQDSAAQLKVRWRFDAGDAFTPTIPTATKTTTHQYATITGNSQTFQVTLEVTDTDGMTGTATKSVTVTIPGVKITPPTATVFVTESQTFTANLPVTWTVVETGGGSITTTGVYTAPERSGTYHVRATTTDGTNRTATATITVPTPSLTFTDASNTAITQLTAEVLSSTTIKVVKQNTSKPVVLSVDETGGGSISSQTGTFNAPGRPQINTIRATLQLTGTAAAARRGRQTVVYDATLPVMVIKSYYHENDQVKAVAFSPHKDANDIYLLARALDNGVLVVDSQRWTGHTGQINSIAFNPPNAAEKNFLLASGGEDGKVKLWNPLTGVEKAIPTSANSNWHTKAVNCVALGLNPNVSSDEELMLASGGDDNTAKLWKVNFTNTATAPVTLGTHRGTVNSVAFTYDGGWLATADNQGYVYLWNVRNNGAAGLSWDAKMGTLSTLAFSPDGTMLAVGNATGRLKIFERSTGNLMKELVDTNGTAHRSRVSGIAWCPKAPVGETDHNFDNLRLVSCSLDRNGSNVKLWDINASAPLRVYAGHSQEATGVSFRPDAYTAALWPSFASCGNDDYVRVWP